MTMANTMEPLTLDDRLVHRLFREETARWRPGGYEDRGECDGWLEGSRVVEGVSESAPEGQQAGIPLPACRLSDLPI